MKTLTIYDPAMCCSTGICGAEVDQNLVDFAANLDWLKSSGVTVTRFNLSQEPAAFVENGTVKSILEDAGVEGLPVVMTGEKMHSSGRYPGRVELAEMAGISHAPTEDPSKSKQNSGCC